MEEHNNRGGRRDDEKRPVFVLRESAKPVINDLPGDRVLKLNVKHITKPIGGPNNGNIRRLQIECEVCKEVYKSSGDLKAHYRSTKHGKFNCSYCKACFITRGSLKQHTQVRHREDIINSILNETNKPEQKTDPVKSEQNQATKENSDKNNNNDAKNNTNNGTANMPKETGLKDENYPVTSTVQMIEPRVLQENTPNKTNSNNSKIDHKADTVSTNSNGVKTITIKIADLRRKLNSMTTKK